MRCQKLAIFGVVALALMSQGATAQSQRREPQVNYQRSLDCVTIALTLNGVGRRNAFIDPVLESHLQRLRETGRQMRRSADEVQADATAALQRKRDWAIRYDADPSHQLPRGGSPAMQMMEVELFACYEMAAAEGFLVSSR